jgi:enoyl-CoA hydratase/carnithine racemase
MDDLKMIRVQIADHIAVVTRDNPPVNAQNAELQDEMIR